MSLVIREMTKEDLEKMVSADRLDRSEYELTEKDLEPLIRYVENRILPGDFLTAVLSNNLSEAAGCADLYNRRRLFEYVSWLYNEAPATCWGSSEKVASWVNKNPEVSE